MHTAGNAGPIVSEKWRLMIVAAVVIVAFFFTYDSDPIKKEKVSRQKIVAPTDDPTPFSWKLCFRKPPGAKAVHPSQKGVAVCNPAKVVVYNDAHFGIKGTYHHQWKSYEMVLDWQKAKNPNGGDWSQPAPKAGGRWFMEKVGPTAFSGWYTDPENKEEGALWLKAVE